MGLSSVEAVGNSSGVHGVPLGGERRTAAAQKEGGHRLRRPECRYGPFGAMYRLQSFDLKSLQINCLASIQRLHLFKRVLILDTATAGSRNERFRAPSLDQVFTTDDIGSGGFGNSVDLPDVVRVAVGD